ncbi:hypothetical protein ACIOWI_29570 [Streptomyces sp. NPDC087659]|uniref:hypothetical protein n=1 Tax=Streptomyces sp. NPDC087659 TaxID=3365801 RepID=UPI0037F612C5
MIENTSEHMKDEANQLLFLAASMGPGGSGQAITEQERAGQAQLVNSDRLPAKMPYNAQADFEALGFTFGEVDPRDPLFRPATLPTGWKRQASDHDMWSYVVDELGRRRVGVFYKAAFYDRRASMSLTSVDTYVRECIHDGADIVTDDTWATPSAVAAAARRMADERNDNVKLWTGRGEDQYRAEAIEARDKYAAVAARFEGTGTDG